MDFKEDLCKHAKSYKSVNISLPLPVCKKTSKYCVKVVFIPANNDLTFTLNDTSCSLIDT